MKRIGYFKKNGEVFSGVIALLHMRVMAQIAPVQSRHSSNAPDYIIMQSQENRFSPELGHAWQRYTREKQTPYLTLRIDDPICPQPIHAMLWQGTDEDYHLYWDRSMTDGEPPEELFVQEELKVAVATFRSFQRMTTERINQLFPALASG